MSERCNNLKNAKRSPITKPVIELKEVKNAPKLSESDFFH
ncbi:hypothetical protein HPCPY1962_0312 [Helicobacter pylori CPY1962]|nr:hypothetical protein HPCPY1962_0312 [Helicobacter pylori CPY1962]